MSLDDVRYTACIPPFSLSGYPVNGRNGTVKCLSALQGFFSMFNPDFVVWAYRPARTEECKIPPVLDYLPEGFVPGCAIFTWVQDGVFVNADERGIFIGNSEKQYLVSLSDSGAILPTIELVHTPLEDMGGIAREIFMKFFPLGPPEGLQ